MTRYKRVTITIPDWIYQKYISGIESNKSSFIVEMFVKGATTEIGETQTDVARQIELVKELRNKDEELKRLKLQIASLKSKEPDQAERERIAADKINKGLKLAGILRRAGQE